MDILNLPYPGIGAYYAAAWFEGPDDGDRDPPELALAFPPTAGGTCLAAGAPSS